MRKRRWICLTVLFLMAFCLVFPALATPGEATLFPERKLQPGEMYEYTRSMAGDGTNLWILRGQSDALQLYRWAPGEAEPARCGEAISDESSFDFLVLVSGKGTAYALDTLEGRLGELTGDGVIWRDAPLTLPEDFQPDLDIPDVW